MLFLRSWLEEYINLNDYTNSQLADTLSLTSGECEGFTQSRECFENKVLVGRIENVKNHPNADKLKCFEVNMGEAGRTKIVSGAPNVQEGMLVPVAIVGAKLPFLTIADRKIRGENSSGMCCGKSELMLETEFSSGLWELPENFTEFLGKSICEVATEEFAEETVFDIKYLQDRFSSCGNYLGLALELSICLQRPELLTQKAKKLLDSEELLEELQRLLPDFVAEDDEVLQVDFDDQTKQTDLFFLCKAILPKEYTLPHIWQKRLFLTGKNLIGGVADLSNYLLYDIGQPTHFFSLPKVLELDENRDSIHWRIVKAQEGVEFAGLGQLKQIQVPKNIPIMINNSGQIVHIPGISGGQSTKIDKEDTHILVEIAHFPSEMAARTSFALNYRSDASKFWAAGINLSLHCIALTRLLQSLPTEAQFQVLLTWCNPKIDLYKSLRSSENILEKVRSILSEENQKRVKVDISYIASRLDGQSLTYWKPIIEEKLSLLGQYEDGFLLPNVFYSQLKNNEDILFEIAKLIGFSSLQPEYLIFSNESVQSKNYHIWNAFRSVFKDFGFGEIITRPFLSEDDLLSSLQNQPIVALKAISSQRQDENFVRDSLLPSLLKNLSTNIQRGEKNPRIFELSKVYQLQGKLTEKMLLEGVCMDNDPYILTSVIENIRKQTKATILEIKQNEETAFGKSVSYQFSNQIKINLTEVSKSVKKKFEIALNKTVWAISVDLTDFDLQFNPYNSFQDESHLPSISRNYSIFLPRKVQWQEVLDCLQAVNYEHCQISIEPKERLNSKDLESNQDTELDILNFSVDFVSYTQTLESNDIQNWENTIMKKLSSKWSEIKWR